MQEEAESDNEQQPVSAWTRSRETPKEVLDGPVSSRTRSHDAGASILAVIGGTRDEKDTGEDGTCDDEVWTQGHDQPAEVLNGPVSSRTRSRDPKSGAALQLMAVDTFAEDDTIDTDDSWP